MLGKFESIIKYGQTRNTGNIRNKTNYLRIQISFKYWTLLSLECKNKEKQNKAKTKQNTHKKKEQKKKITKTKTTTKTNERKGKN